MALFNPRRLRLALAAPVGSLLFLTACNGGSHAVPPVTTAPGATVPQSKLSFGVPRTASNGVRFLVNLPLRNSGELDRLIESQSSPGSPAYHQYLTPEQFRAAYGPTEADLTTVAESLQRAGMQVNFSSQGVGAVGSTQAVESYFNIKLRTVQSIRGGAHMESTTALKVPQALKQLGAVVSPFAKLQVKPYHEKTAAVVDPQNRYSPTGPYWFTDLKQAYSWPSYQSANGAGRKIAIVMASDYNAADMANYFGHEQLAVPAIVSRPVDGGAAFDPNSGASFEDELDIQQSGGMAPGATIINYNMPDLSVVPSTLDAYTAVVEDNQADVVNSSFGLCELYFTAAYNGGQDFTYLFQTFHDVFRQGNAQGITWVAASGDNGALGCTDPSGSRFIFGISWPVSDPNVTAVGGTNLVTTTVAGSRNSAYVRENAYSDPLDPALVGATGGVWGSGGGIGTYWARPAYQRLVDTGSTMRTIPDLALHMGGCPFIAIQPCGPDRSFDIEAFAGGFYGVVGTSASSPDFAGLLAVKSQHLGGHRLGNENFAAYALAAGNQNSQGNDDSQGDNGMFFRNNIPGNNGYPSHRGYNYVVGNGSVVGNNYALMPNSVAGLPQTPSNP